MTATEAADRISDADANLAGERCPLYVLSKGVEGRIGGAAFEAIVARVYQATDLGTASAAELAVADLAWEAAAAAGKGR